MRRLLKLKETLNKKSCFLLGPRQTGKTTLLEIEFPEIPIIQLLDAETRRLLLQNPSRLESLIRPNQKIAIIDEVQKIPELLDQVHLLIEKRKINFLLTGSSARKLKSGGVNLLGGRARKRKLHPLVSAELKDDFDLKKALSIGTLPSIYFSDSPVEDLNAYVSEYLTQEIMAEGISRNAPAFSRFLEVAALSNAQTLNFSEIGSDAEVKRTTVQNYYEILADTLIGMRLAPWMKSKTRKAVATEKFYFFDPGVVNALVGRKEVSLKTPESGFLFETLILNELVAYRDYFQIDYELSFWKSKSGLEVDFMMNDGVAIEVKAKETISSHDLKGLLALRDERKTKKMYCLYLGKLRQTLQNIEIIPYADFLKELWNGSVVD